MRQERRREEGEARSALDNVIGQHDRNDSFAKGKRVGRGVRAQGRQTENMVANSCLDSAKMPGNRGRGMNRGVRVELATDAESHTVLHTNLILSRGRTVDNLRDWIWCPTCAHRIFTHGGCPRGSLPTAASSPVIFQG